jgi:hypothetical protein
MSTDTLIVLSNIVLTVVTLLGSLVTIVDIHREDQRTLRMILFGKVGFRIPKRHPKGKHE